jgi:hypothetical protein
MALFSRSITATPDQWLSFARVCWEQNCESELALQLWLEDFPVIDQRNPDSWEMAPVGGIEILRPGFSEEMIRVAKERQKSTIFYRAMCEQVGPPNGLQAKKNVYHAIGTLLEYQIVMQAIIFEGWKFSTGYEYFRAHHLVNYKIADFAQSAQNMSRSLLTSLLDAHNSFRELEKIAWTECSREQILESGFQYGMIRELAKVLERLVAENKPIEGWLRGGEQVPDFHSWFSIEPLEV